MKILEKRIELSRFFQSKILFTRLFAPPAKKSSEGCEQIIHYMTRKRNLSSKSIAFAFERPSLIHTVSFVFMFESSWNYRFSIHAYNIFLLSLKMEHAESWMDSAIFSPRRQMGLLRSFQFLAIDFKEVSPFLSLLLSYFQTPLAIRNHSQQNKIHHRTQSKSVSRCENPSRSCCPHMDNQKRSFPGDFRISSQTPSFRGHF